MRALRVDAIAGSGQQYGGRAFNDGLREASLHHVPVHIARCGDRWATDDGVALSVLSPCGALFADGKNDANENSVVVMLAYQTFRMLFMGDAGRSKGVPHRPLRRNHRERRINVREHDATVRLRHAHSLPPCRRAEHSKGANRAADARRSSAARSGGRKDRPSRYSVLPREANGVMIGVATITREGSEL